MWHAFGDLWTLILRLDLHLALPNVRMILRIILVITLRFKRIHKSVDIVSNSLKIPLRNHHAEKASL